MGAVAWSFPETSFVEKRRHQRVRIRLAGKFMRADRTEFSCDTIDISPGGVAFATDATVYGGERIVAYMNQIGRIEGRVARAFVGGFAMQMKLPPVKLEKLAEQLTWLVNRQVLGMPEDRRHERLVPHNTRATLKLANGRELQARLIDVSVSGAAMLVDIQPSLGSAVVIGTTPAQVVRVFPGGLAVEFQRLIPAEQFDEGVKL